MKMPLIEKGKQYIKALTKRLEDLKKRLEEPKSIRDRDLLDFIKALSLSFCLALIWFLFENEFIRLFNKHILPLSLKMNFNFITHCLFGIIVILIIRCIHKYYKKTYFIPWNILLPSSFSIVVYIICRVKYYGALPWGIVGYSDILILLLAIFLFVSIRNHFKIKLKTNLFLKKKEQPQKSAFIPDTPINKIEDDQLDYSNNALELANQIESIQANNSFSIGLTAPWGTGKTSFLNLLELQLDKKKFIIIKFNPRHSYKAANIQGDFFNILYSELQKYDSRFSSSFKDYLKAIDVINENKILSVLFNIHKIWNKESEKDKINTAIKRLSKRIIVIIEDFDRLFTNEIIEVFKLIDGNASFTNLIFITAYDKILINKILRKEYLNSETCYSEKFFDLEMQIPLRPYSKIYNYLITELAEKLNLNSEKRSEYNSSLSNIVDLLKQYLTTLRDVKRFLNLFLNQYKQVEEEVEFYDYFLLYLIKYKYLNEYLTLYKEVYIAKTNISNLQQNTLKKNLNPKSKEILELLFGEGRNCQYRTINNDAVFKIYFHEATYGHLTLKEMKAMLYDDWKYVKEKIDNTVSENYLQDILDYSNSRNILTFDNRECFERFLDIIFYIYCKHESSQTQLYFNILSFVYTGIKNQIIEVYQYTEDKYKELITKKLQGDYPDYPFMLTRQIIMGIINQQFEKEIIFDHNDLLKIAQAALDDLIKHDKKVKQEHFRLLYSCIDDINQNTRKISLNKDSCAKIKQLIEEHPSGYFQNFVLLGMISSSPDFNSITCEGFWRQIFGDAESFKTFIDSQNEETIPNIKLIRNFWKLYENNNYKPIAFENQGNVQEKIDRGLVHEVKQLDELIQIEQEFDNYEKDREKTPQEENNQTYLSNYEKLINRIDNIDLYITKTGQIKNKIANTINEIKKS